ncbi:MAG TPA: ElyC/SanA/YdcF family protein [Anaerolineales bacterium]|jgi:vancomycin permeability regulator SanA
MKILLRLLLAILVLTPITFILPRLITAIYAWPRLHRVEDVPAKPVAIVFGAGLWRDGSPTPVLRDRVATAVELYFQGKVNKLLMSGDNRVDNYNEPAAMEEFAIGLGVPAEDIILDYAGQRTYDTCFRAKEIFGLQDAILVTQEFHLPRAIYTCNSLGVDALGVAADRREYRRRQSAFWQLREVAATFVALWDIHITRPRPILGNPEPIFPMEAQ